MVSKTSVAPTPAKELLGALNLFTGGSPDVFAGNETHSLQVLNPWPSGIETVLDDLVQFVGAALWYRICGMYMETSVNKTFVFSATLNPKIVSQKLLSPLIAILNFR